MVILPYVKLGTVPFGPARVKNRKERPKEGDIIFIRENNPKKTLYQNPWIRVQVDQVRDNEIFFVSRKSY